MENIEKNNHKKLNKIFKKNQMKAKKLINSPAKVIELVNKALDKTNNNEGPFDKVLDNLQLCASIVKDYIKGNYKQVPLGSIIAIIAALIYLVSPIDLIPDTLPLGITDDLYIIGLVIKQVDADLKKYIQWKDQKNTVSV